MSDIARLPKHLKGRLGELEELPNPSADDLPDHTPRDCPDCGAELTVQTAFLDEDTVAGVVLECIEHAQEGQVCGYTYYTEAVLYRLHEKPAPLPWKWRGD